MKSFTPPGTSIVLQIMDIRGKDYLQVAHRVHWFRTVRPEWSIETEALKFGDNFAIFKSSIKNEQGRIIATATKHEDSKGFPDFIEKAETGSIGRALALCGFGTQFCADELDERDRLADAPIERVIGSQRIAPDQPQWDEGAPHIIQPYTFPGGSEKGRTPLEVFNTKGREHLCSMADIAESKIKLGESYKGVTVDQMKRMVKEIENVIVQFENGDLANEPT